MEIIGAFDAKTHWSALLDKVALGQEIVITKRGRPVARLVPELSNTQEELTTVIEEIKAMRKGAMLGDDLDWQSLRDEGRR